jgi:hypothetical protein
VLAALAAAPAMLRGQAIEFEQNGLRYQTLTRNGLTIMFTFLPTQLKNYGILQVAVSNGGQVSWTVKPEDFVYRRPDGSALHPMPPRKVVDRMLESAGRNDVIRLVSAYELGLYGLSRLNSTSGYEKRRQQALAEVSSARLKAAAAASAVVFVAMKMQPGQSTDGALFFETDGKPIGEGILSVRAAGETFTFTSAAPQLTFSERPPSRP